VQIDFSRPGKPTDNSFVESFNGSLRDECLNVNWFESIEEAKARIEDWRRDYNETRPHQALGEQTPEPPRVYRRLHSLRGWSHGTQEQVFPGGS
jgi:putative transposase